MRYDLRTATASELAAFIFAHEVARGAGDETVHEWFWTDSFTVEFDPCHQVETATRMFESSADLCSLYTQDQIEQGLWFMFGRGGDQWFVALLAEAAVPLRLRQRFIAALYDLYADLLSNLALGMATFMLWDLVIAQFWDRGTQKVVVPSDLSGTMFATLARILALPDRECQRAALHGLGHLRHMETQTLVSEYLAQSGALPDDLRTYATLVRDGSMIP